MNWLDNEEARPLLEDSCKWWDYDKLVTDHYYGRDNLKPVEFLFEKSKNWWPVTSRVPSLGLTTESCTGLLLGHWQTLKQTDMTEMETFLCLWLVLLALLLALLRMLLVLLAVLLVLLLALPRLPWDLRTGSSRAKYLDIPITAHNWVRATLSVNSQSWQEERTPHQARWEQDLISIRK